MWRSKLLAELPDERLRGIARRPTAADRPPHHVVAHVEDQLDVPCRPFPASIRPTIVFSHPVPRARRALPARLVGVEVHEDERARTMQVPSGMTITPPDPAIVPIFAIDSMSYDTSISSGRSTGVDDPPDDGLEYLPSLMRRRGGR